MKSYFLIGILRHYRNKKQQIIITKKTKDGRWAKKCLIAYTILGPQATGSTGSLGKSEWVERHLHNRGLGRERIGLARQN